MLLKPFLNVFQRSVRCLDFALCWTLIFLMGFMVLNVLWQISTRFVLSSPSSYTEEIARFLLIWIGLLGGCHAYRVGAHLGLDILASKLQQRGRQYLQWLISVAVLGLAGSVLVYGGGKLMLLTHELQQTSAAMGIPMYAVYVVLPLSGGILCLYALDALLSGADLHRDSQS